MFFFFVRIIDELRYKRARTEADCRQIPKTGNAIDATSLRQHQRTISISIQMNSTFASRRTRGHSTLAFRLCPWLQRDTFEWLPPKNSPLSTGLRRSFPPFNLSALPFEKFRIDRVLEWIFAIKPWSSSFYFASRRNLIETMCRWMQTCPNNNSFRAKPLSQLNTFYWEYFNYFGGTRCLFIHKAYNLHAFVCRSTAVGVQSSGFTLQAFQFSYDYIHFHVLKNRQT